MIYYPPGHLGCYADSVPRDLYLLLVDGSSNMTIEYCSSLCQLQYYKYAGIQKGYIKNYDFIKLIYHIIDIIN